MRRCCCHQKKPVLSVKKEPVYEYLTIWAEENGALNNGSAEWSFGNGATGFMGIPMDDSGEWELVSMFFHADTFATNASVTINMVDFQTPSVAAPIIGTINLVNAADGGGTTNNARKHTELTTPAPVPAGAIIGFRTVGGSGSRSDCRVGGKFRRKLFDAVTEVSIY